MISVVVPILNEADNIPGLISHLKSNCLESTPEIVFSDGGSTDGSREICLKSDVRYINGSRGRSRQLNAGAAQARGEILYFPACGFPAGLVAMISILRIV